MSEEIAAGYLNHALHVVRRESNYQAIALFGAKGHGSSGGCGVMGDNLSRCWHGEGSWAFLCGSMEKGEMSFLGHNMKGASRFGPRPNGTYVLA